MYGLWSWVNHLVRDKVNDTCREMARAAAELAVNEILHMVNMVVVAESPGFPVSVEKCDAVAEVGDVR